uniref:Uncharacterized protein n=1 Tax=Oncorhynchus kisutch TaxID=8019 RepID=A0A8C7F4G0_ONCKI
ALGPVRAALSLTLFLSPLSFTIFFLSLHSNHLSSVRVLERTIRSAVEQHLFDVHMCGGGQSTTEDSEWTGCSSSPVVTPTARQRRRHQREQEEAQRHRDRRDINKENIPAAGSVSRTISCGVSVGEEGVWRDYQTSQGGLHHEGPRPRKPKHCHQSPTLGQLSDNQDPHAVSHSLSSLSFSVSLAPSHCRCVSIVAMSCRSLVEFRWRSNIQNSTSKTITSCLPISEANLFAYFAVHAHHLFS